MPKVLQGHEMLVSAYQGFKFKIDQNQMQGTVKIQSPETHISEALVTCARDDHM